MTANRLALLDTHCTKAERRMVEFRRQSLANAKCVQDRLERGNTAHKKLVKVTQLGACRWDCPYGGNHQTLANAIGTDCGLDP